MRHEFLPSHSLQLNEGERQAQEVNKHIKSCFDRGLEGQMKVGKRGIRAPFFTRWSGQASQRPSEEEGELERQDLPRDKKYIGSESRRSLMCSPTERPARLTDPYCGHQCPFFQSSSVMGF